MKCPHCKEDLKDVTLTYEIYVEATASEGPDGRLNLTMRKEYKGDEIIRLSCASCEEEIDLEKIEIGEII